MPLVDTKPKQDNMTIQNSLRLFWLHLGSYMYNFKNVVG